MVLLLKLLVAGYLGGVLALTSYYVQWLTVNPQFSVHWFTAQTILGWPWYRAVDLVACSAACEVLRD